MSTVLLFKAISDDEDKDDRYVKSIGQSFPDLKVKPISVLQFVFEDPKILSKEIENVNDYDGLILTSPRSVEAVSRAFASTSLDLSQNFPEIWRQEKTCYVVGDSSFCGVKRLLLWKEDHIRGQETGNGKNLSKKIIEDVGATKKSAKFLFPCGNLKRDILPENLAQSGIELKIVECYKTQLAEELESSIEKLKDEIGSLDVAVFFSPSGVKFSWPILSKQFPEFERDCKFISIGPVTSEALNSKGCRNVFTSPNPNADGIIEAFKLAFQ